MARNTRFRILGIALTVMLVAFIGWRLMPGTSAQKSLGPADQKSAAAETYAPMPDDDGLLLLNARQIAVKSQDAQAERRAIESFAGKRMHLFRFSGPIRGEWVKMLTDSGAEIVDYIPHYTYLIYGDSPSLQRVKEKATEAQSPIQWDGEFRSDYRLHPSIYFQPKSDNGQTGLRSNEFQIQLVRDDAANGETFKMIESLKTAEIKGRQNVRHFVNFVVGLDEKGMQAVADRPDVVSIYPYIEPEMMDERQNFILRGNLTGTDPTPGDWLAYLASKGFTQAQFDASNFVVDVSDSGVDTATPATPNQFLLRAGGSPTGTSRLVYARIEGTGTGTAQGCDGHGNLNATIVAGYVPTGAPFNAAPHADALGFRYGMGIAPFVKVGSSAIFTPTYQSPNFANLQSKAYNDGARISTNSWGAAVGGAYTVDAQTYDGLVRDAQPTGSTNAAPGNQQMVILFSSGNNGAGANTIGAPGTGKNIMSVGASENVHPFGAADQCGTTDAQANSAMDIVPFSSRGPNDDGRFKPDIMLPGTHVTGGVAQAANVDPVTGGNGAQLACFNANGVCAGPGTSNFFPLGQQWYTASSGTSHSTPAIAGYAALIRQDFINRSLAPPSPAMSKALMMNSTEYMTGVGANDNLPSNSQGMGLADMDRYFAMFDQARILRDQEAADVFTDTGQTRIYTGTVADNTKPFRVTLAWTDQPGPTSGNAYVNNLDLEVTVGGNAYKGNRFTSGGSATGGTADVRNNTESVFVPAGVTGTFLVRVRATNIAGNGLPDNPDATDQDYALIASNASESPQAVVENTGITITSESATPANGVPDPGETLTVDVSLQNVGTANSGTVTATLQNTGGITNPSGPQNYGVLNAGAAAVTRPFTFSVPAGATCGNSITLTFAVQEGSNTSNVTKTYTLGVQTVSISENFNAATPPALPAGWTSTVAGAGVAWVTSTTGAIGAPNSAFVPDPATTGESSLVTPVFLSQSAATQVNFNLFHDTENTWDGVVLEVKIGAGAFQDILAAGGSFAANGYNGTLGNFSGCSANPNPLATRAAWTGGPTTRAVQAVLPASAQGQNVQLRFRMGHDCSVADVGARVDDVVILGGFSCALAASNAVRADFDGDGRTDLSVWRPSEGNWYLQQTTDGFQTVSWGLNNDRIQPGDIDADGEADFAVYRPSNNTWYGINSSDNTFALATWGAAGDIPVLGHYVNAGLEDTPAVWRPSNGRWYIYGDTYREVAFGQMGDVPVPGDYNGDGTTDYAVYRPTTGEWHLSVNSVVTVTTLGGAVGDMPVPADYDNDNKDDIAIFRPSTGRWSILKSGSGNSLSETFWGLLNDVPVPGDYDGDGSYDIAVWRPSEGRWYIIRSTAGIVTANWGLNNDKPAPVGYIPN